MASWRQNASQFLGLDLHHVRSATAVRSVRIMKLKLKQFLETIAETIAQRPYKWFCCSQGVINAVVWLFTLFTGGGNTVLWVIGINCVLACLAFAYLHWMDVRFRREQELRQSQLEALQRLNDRQNILWEQEMSQKYIEYRRNLEY